MIVLSETRWLWPVVLFPFATERSHTRAFTGRHRVRHVKVGLGLARLTLTDSELTARRLWSRRPWLRVARRDIRRVDPVAGKPGLVLVRFEDAEFSRAASFALSGGPPGRRDEAILNVRDPDAWIRELGRDRAVRGER